MRITRWLAVACVVRALLSAGNDCSRELATGNWLWIGLGQFRMDNNKKKKKKKQKKKLKIYNYNLRTCEIDAENDGFRSQKQPPSTRNFKG